MFLRNPRNYSKIGFEVATPHHGLRAEGTVEGANPSLRGKKTNSIAERGPEMA